MNTVLNKSYRPVNKELKPSTKGKSIFQNIEDAVDNINTAPDVRDQYLKGIEEAKATMEAATKAKEEAETEEAFNKACDDFTHARDKETFYNNALKRLETTPRMEERKYDELLEGVEKTVEKASAEYRKIAEKALDELLKAKVDYMAVLTEADEALIKLDRVANVMQTRFDCSIQRFTTDDPNVFREEKTKNPNEWRNHAVRYCTGRGRDIATKDSIKAYVAWDASNRYEYLTK